MKSVKNLTKKDFDGFIKKGISVIDFSADWCIPCKILKPIFQEVAKEVEGVNFGSVDVDKENDLAQRFYIMSVTTGNPVFKKEFKKISGRIDCEIQEL